VAGRCCNAPGIRQDGAQVRLVQGQGQGPVEELTAQGADETFADRVHPRCLHRGACTAVRRIVMPVAWKTASKEGVKFEPRSRIRNRKPVNRWPRSRARFAVLLHRPHAGRVGGDAADVHPAGAVLDQHR
jgi:hypothetical protein